MNFLAHAYLSGNNSQIMVGNFMGDFIKGDPHAQLPTQMANGVLLHRAIDEFTDSNTIVKASKKRLWAKYRHYAAVIVDIYYDHFLAKNFDRYSDERLKDFTAKVYATLHAHETYLPQRTKMMLPFMEKDDWMYHYGSIWGISQALSGMARRSRFDSKMDESVIDLEEKYSLFEQEFFSFFPLLQAHCNSLKTQFDL